MLLTKGQYFAVRLEQASMINSLLYGNRTKLVYLEFAIFGVHKCTDHDRLRGITDEKRTQLRTNQNAWIYLNTNRPYNNVPYLVLHQPWTWRRWTADWWTRLFASTWLRYAFLSIEVVSSRTWTTLNFCSTTTSLVPCRTFALTFASGRDGNVCFISTTVCTWSAARKFC